MYHDLWKWLFGVDAVLLVALLLLTLTGWATDDGRVYRDMQEKHDG